MKILIVAASAAFLLGGCAQYDTAKKVVQTNGAAAADRGLEFAVFAVCDAPTAGALRRWFGNDKDAAAKWKAFCDLKRGSVAP